MDIMAWLDSFSGLAPLEKTFIIFAVIGGLVFAFRTLLQMFGHADVHHLDGNISDTDFHDSDVDFKVLSLQGLSSFFLMFGLVGMACLRTGQTGPVVAILVGASAGAASVWLIGKLFNSMKSLQSSGNWKIENTIGAEGNVYLNIPAGGTGRVQVAFQNRVQEFDARTENGEALETGTLIKVLRVVGTHELVVEKAS